MTYTEEQVKELLHLQRQNCKHAYLSFFAGSEEDFAAEPIVRAIENAPEPANFYTEKPVKQPEQPFKDELVRNSLLEVRIKNVVKGMCETPGYYDFRRKHDGFFDGKKWEDLYLSDLGRLSYREWMRVRNIGRKAADNLKLYLSEHGVALEH